MNSGYKTQWIADLVTADEDGVPEDVFLAGLEWQARREAEADEEDWRARLLAG